MYTGLISLFWTNCTKVNFTYVFQKYLKDMETYFGAEPKSVNFVGASGQIRTEINSWVEGQTGGKLFAQDTAKKGLLQISFYLYEVVPYTPMCFFSGTVGHMSKYSK